MRLETLFGATHKDRIRLALNMPTNEVIESNFCDRTGHYCQIDKVQLPWSPIVQSKLIRRCKRLNSFIVQALHINCGCFVVYKFLNSPHVTMINRILSKDGRQLLTYTLSLKEITNEFPYLEKVFFDVHNVERFQASKMLMASLTSRITRNRIRLTRLIQKPQLYLQPLVGGIVVVDGGSNNNNNDLVLSIPFDISKFVLGEKIGKCLHESIDVIRSSDRSHDEGESFYNVCRLCYKTLNKLT